MHKVVQILRGIKDAMGWVKLPSDIRDVLRFVWEHFLRSFWPGALMALYALWQSYSLWVVGACLFGMFVVTRVFGEPLVEVARKRLSGANSLSRAPTNQPIDEDLKQRCCKLAAELSEPIRQWQNGVDGAQRTDMVARVQRGFDGDPDGSLEIRSHGIWLMKEYRDRFWAEVLKLSDELYRHGCITPETRNRFENAPTTPEDVQAIAQRLKVICDTSDEG